MTKKLLKQLVVASYKNNNLNPKTIEKIAKVLSRKELKQYIKALKTEENKRNVIVSLPYLPKNKDKKSFEGVFQNKKILYDIDKSLILGVKITKNDLVYEMSLKNSLENLITHVGGIND